ncbi:serine hydrolase domain-containing protein [Chitinophaga sp. MM2321]|uniref:serine hydrolase domain-containing protein n=1 Tax=Chitinophaga sp. MM2321 TaxID=3137178 RepID=UPI0032D584EE
MNFPLFSILIAGCFSFGLLEKVSCQSLRIHMPVPGKSIPQVDEVVDSFMARYQVPGMSVAITRNGKLVYASGYGTADKATGEKVSPASLFRIASVSKSITATAILKLVEAKKLSLDDNVFGPGAILGTSYGTRPYSNWLKAITIRELLQHTGGGWSNNGEDPMFSNPGMTAPALIAWTLDHISLKYAPGTVYAYSNFGYCVLGRVIEKVTGLSYEQYVKSAILAPLGITTMQTGGNTMADRKKKEVKYYGQHGENPYDFDVARMDAHGGWIASATDLARFLAGVDGFPTRPDVLSKASIMAMTTPSTANPNYALGWLVNVYHNWWHSGSLPGTASEIVRAGNGFSWVLLCNTRAEEGFFNDLDGLIWKAVNDKTTRWPDVDLFQAVP